MERGRKVSGKKIIFLRMQLRFMYLSIRFASFWSLDKKFSNKHDCGASVLMLLIF